MLAAALEVLEVLASKVLEEWLNAGDIIGLAGEGSSDVELFECRYGGI